MNEYLVLYKFRWNDCRYMNLTEGSEVVEAFSAKEAVEKVCKNEHRHDHVITNIQKI